MSALTFTLREEPAQRIDLSGLTPDKLKDLSQKNIADLPLWIGNREVSTGDLFDISGDDANTLVFANACARLDHIGADMKDGDIRIQGDAGAFTGRGLRGGRIQVHGNAGSFSGAGMSKGYLQIDGDAGDFTGSALAGERVGMNGGMILIKGGAGDRTGDRQRRGTILIEGDCGDYCASRMIAGTIAVWGGIGAQAGCGMRRGTLLLQQMPAELWPATFNDNGTHELSFVRLLLDSFNTLDSRFATLAASNSRTRRFLGDLACGGMGEILILSDS